MSPYGVCVFKTNIICPYGLMNMLLFLYTVYCIVVSQELRKPYDLEAFVSALLIRILPIHNHSKVSDY